MLVTTTDTVPNHNVQNIIGVAFGSCVMTKNFAADIGAGIQNIVGGETRDYSALLEDARRIATERMIYQAHCWGAHAIVGMKYMSAEIMQGAAEIIAYGTAVQFENAPRPHNQPPMQQPPMDPQGAMPEQPREGSHSPEPVSVSEPHSRKHRKKGSPRKQN